jgi:hypothetical protein
LTEASAFLGFRQFVLDAFIDFGAVHIDVLRRFDAKANVVSVDRENAHANVVTDGNGFAHNATEYEHKECPSGITGP